MLTQGNLQEWKDNLFAKATQLHVLIYQLNIWRFDHLEGEKFHKTCISTIINFNNMSAISWRAHLGSLNFMG